MDNAGGDAQHDQRVQHGECDHRGQRVKNASAHNKSEKSPLPKGSRDTRTPSGPADARKIMP